MVSIFNDLLRLKSNSNIIPLEDFFTEIFAYLLKSSDALLYEWLNYFSISHIEYDNSFVSTQESYDALDGHLTGSRPDILIELSNKNQNQVIFIECKIDSAEGNNQLRRYAEQLDDISNIDYGVLIYITRDYEKKAVEIIFDNCKNPSKQAAPKRSFLYFFCLIFQFKRLIELLFKVFFSFGTACKLKFIQLRWYENYQFLNSNRQNVMVEEALKFMEENNMSLNNKFSNIDVLALTNFPKVRKMMDETMFGDVSTKFETIAKGITKSSTCLTQLRDHNRYIYYHWQNSDFWIGLGYWIDPSIITNYPDVGIVMEVSPSAKNRTEIIETMIEIEKTSQEKWMGYNLTEARAWSGIVRNKSLQNFIHEPDHIIEIKRYFLELLDDVTSIRDAHPNLPWKD